MPSDHQFNYLNAQSIAAAHVRRSPYEFAYTDNAIAPVFKDQILADVPQIPSRGSYGLPSLRYGAEFGRVIDDLLSPQFREIVGKKFDTDLQHCPPVILMMGNTTGHYNEGYAHPDSKHKIITVLLGFSREWPYEKGRLRVLNSDDRNDYAFEYPPEFGKMLMFRVSDKSWHGFLPQKGPRTSLQLCYCDSRSYVAYEYFRHSISAFVKANPTMRKVLDRLPKNYKGLLPNRTGK